MQNYVDGPSERFITSSEDGLDVIDQEKWRKRLYRVLSPSDVQGFFSQEEE